MPEAVKLETLVNSLVEIAPPCELNEVRSDLLSILTSQQGSKASLDDAIEQYINENFTVLSSTYIASKYNKHKTSTKYIDYVNKKMFNIDLSSQQAIDFESYNEGEYPEYFDLLVEGLEKYGNDYFPSEYVFTVIPEGPDVHIIIIGQRVNNSNFYTGQFKSYYKVSGSSIKGSIKLDIHYYEEGNVRLNFKEDVDDQLPQLTASSIVNSINKFETDITLKIIQHFNKLNQESFKNLRRLLPVTRSKINWGRAIGNYRLGSDVVNKK